MSDLPDDPEKIWVISDTHLRSGQILPETFTRRVQREDIIIHLGDFISPEIANQLKGLTARLEAVSGNCDPPSIKNEFPPNKVIEIANRKIALIHGRGGYADTVARVRDMYKGKVDAALFGHTHAPHQSKADGTFFFNPGSLIQSRRGPESLGVLHLDGDTPWGEIITL